MRTGILSFLSISYVDVENNDQDFLGTAGMRTGILSFLSISYVDVENNDQDFLGTIGKW
jgi:hypothetical protein